MVTAQENYELLLDFIFPSIIIHCTGTFSSLEYNVQILVAGECNMKKIKVEITKLIWVVS